jgi:NAD(P)-dependent dehydrogenase (short-subunit alcohol dehydrogenase family)
MTTNKVKLAGKRALITGGSSGIGAAIARAYAQEGAAVAIGANTGTERARKLADEINSAGGRAVVVAGDLTSRSDADRIVDETVAALGGLDILVHSAGVDVTSTAPVGETADDVWDWFLAIHLTAAFRVVKRAIPALLKGNKPSVLFIGSVAGLVAWEGDVPYNVAKAGLHHLAKCIAVDYAKVGLRANCLAPGVVDTPLTRGFASGMSDNLDEAMATLAKLHPMGRYAVPAEIAGAAVFLASDEAGFITGTVLPIDGGMTVI